MRRALLALAAAALAAGAAVPAHAAQPALVADARASILAGVLDVQPAFDPAFTDSVSSSSAIGTSNMSSSVWPSFLVDAFFFLYKVQSTEREALGISDARWPQGPFDDDAGNTDLVVANVTNPRNVPHGVGSTEAHAAEDLARGRATALRLQMPFGGVEEARSMTEVATAGFARARAEQHVEDLAIGPVRIRSIRGIAEAGAGNGSSSRADLVVAGVTVADVPVEVTAAGARAGTEEAQRRVEDALRTAGVTLRLVPGVEESGDTAAEAWSGAVLVGVRATTPDPSGSTRTSELGFLFGSARASASATSIASAGPRAPSGGGGSARFVESRIFVPPAEVEPGETQGGGPSIRRRTIVTAAATIPAGLRGAYGAVVLVALVALAIRPLVRAASRT